jgi:hypothetical protein
MRAADRNGTFVMPRVSRWHDIRFADADTSFRKRGANMGEIVRFVPKSEQERARLIREARAIYEQIFPSADQASEPQVPKK